MLGGKYPTLLTPALTVRTNREDIMTTLSIAIACPRCRKYWNNCNCPDDEYQDYLVWCREEEARRIHSSSVPRCLSMSRIAWSPFGDYNFARSPAENVRHRHANLPMVRGISLSQTNHFRCSLCETFVSFVVKLLNTKASRTQRFTKAKMLLY